MLQLPESANLFVSMESDTSYQHTAGLVILSTAETHDFCFEKSRTFIDERLGHIPQFRPDGGAWVLAKIDCDANQRLAAAAGVQGIPAVKAVWQGAIVGEFTGAVPEPELRGWLDQLLQATGSAGAAGEPGTSASGGPGASAPVEDPLHVEAEEAFARGDYDAAERAYEAILANAPGDAAAASALAGVRLFRRAEKLDPAATRAASDAAPDNLDAQLAAADVDMIAGNVAQAFTRLVNLVVCTSGADRDRVRLHLLGLFEAAGPDEPALGPARAALSRALF